MPVEKTLNPRDVEGLEKSLNDSATRVSTIWISYLLFGLYLLVSAGTATDKQLLLEESVKLPALGTEVPLRAFFVISPILFVLLQFYVLLQTLLLGRTAKAYNDVLDGTVKRESDNAIFRERLANTIFAQIFAGAPRERNGWVGNILLGITWFTLIASPILVLLTFQLAFLPYHSPGVTLLHRVLIGAELVIFFWLWPAVLDPEREVHWRGLDLHFWRSEPWSKKFYPAIAAVILFFSWVMASFPGELHMNLLSFRRLDSRNCDGSPGRLLGIGDRIVLRDISIADTEKRAEGSASAADPSKHTILRDWSGRDFSCGTFVGIDFRRTSLEKAHFEGAFLSRSFVDKTTHMQGVFLDDAILGQLTLEGLDLEGASLNRTRLNGATLTDVSVSLATFAGIDLSGATLNNITFDKDAVLSGAILTRATLNNVKLPAAHLEGAGLQHSVFHNSSLAGAILDGADLFGAKLDNTPSDWTPAKGLFGPSLPPNWDKPEEQAKLADAVADTVCPPGQTEINFQAIKNRTEIVTEIVSNALYPTCPDQKATPSNCLPEQPKGYRDRLAARMEVCAAKILKPDLITALRNENGFLAGKP
ncbi:pentapeptide repeat-containing protein [Bradyrhizobium japonicum]|uniref:pentapeptide repeat-containing protein n=1 Tax=Bradyrhizobium japonicum TaxID=375 RepID=UPI0004BBAB81|nr:pentapeptide repeat-containing protein [Bradyrhizobium japonicum]